MGHERRSYRRVPMSGTDQAAQRGRSEHDRAVAEQLFQITVLDRCRTLSEIVSVLVHRRVAVLSLDYRHDRAASCDHILLRIEYETASQIEMLHKRLNRVVDVLKVVTVGFEG
jgi:(p)ppGpp synthase/HD superfamily hydrolase